MPKDIPEGVAWFETKWAGPENRPVEWRLFPVDESSDNSNKSEDSEDSEGRPSSPQRVSVGSSGRQPREPSEDVEATTKPLSIGDLCCGFEFELPTNIPDGTEWRPWERQGWYKLVEIT